VCFSRVLVSSRKSITGTWSPNWDYEFEEINRPQEIENGVKLTLKKQRRGFLGIGDEVGKSIQFPDRLTASNVNAKLLKAYQNVE
jgi:hypothetical protein